MKLFWAKHKYSLLPLINILPFALISVLYAVHVPVDIFLLFLIAIGLTILNYKGYQKAIPYLLCQLLMIICHASTFSLFVSLFPHEFSDDPLAASFIGGFSGIGITFLLVIITIISAIIKAIIKAIIAAGKKRNETRL